MRDMKTPTVVGIFLIFFRKIPKTFDKVISK